jgi:predicted nucleic acid-binding protein
MFKVVYDTNVVVSGLLSSRGAPALLLDLVFNEKGVCSIGNPPLSNIIPVNTQIARVTLPQEAIPKRQGGRLT